MSVPVVDVWVMRVLVRQLFVPMGMHVRFFAIPGEIVLMLVVLVVPVTVRVLQHLVGVLVLVALANVEPYTEGHKRGCCPELRFGHLGPERERNEHSEKRRHRKVRPRPRRAESSQAYDEQRQTQAIAEEADQKA